MKEVKLTDRDIQILLSLLYEESKFKQGERYQKIWSIIKKLRK